MTNNPLKNQADRRKERIDTLAATAGGGTVTGAGEVEEAPGVSLIASAFRRLRRNPVFLVGAAITLGFIILALISPWIMGRKVQLGPSIVIVALAVGSQLFGFIGLLAAVPIAAVLKVAARAAVDAYRASPFFLRRHAP